jgi:hypothetical protein
MAFAIGALIVAAIAYGGLRYYRAALDGSQTLVGEPVDSPAVGDDLTSIPTTALRGAHIDHLFSQRSQIKRLQALLDQKTELLERKTALLEKKTAEQVRLRKQLDEAIVVLEVMADDISQNGEATDEDMGRNGGLHQNLERLREQRYENETQEQQHEEEFKLLITELAATDEEIALLRQQSEMEFSQLLAEKEAFEAVASRALVSIGAESVPVLVDYLTDQRAEIRRWAALVLGDIGPEANEAIPALIHASSSDDDPAVREAARQSLDSISPSG